ncbi:TPM domain-containing protein [Seohaeicola zhoushanensis]|uniref:TPM domain-containing protein n=1 Tax=Seohaeicola zhoushanensis TaxID=1569283 RepID=A0A8J3M7K2_9RHOB|nr:TPM domain-containing protein [Seohaeicola zhoushanensis]GHF53245.1 hypothetical protein GCM10017056_26020 [Seohaeicola zhoushanensis]
MPFLMRLVLVLTLFAGPAAADIWPTYDNPFVNDQAGILPDESEAALRAQLEQLKTDTGIEMTVLTLKSQRDFQPNLSLEEFATGIFDRWGIGDSARNDGILVLVLRQDRAMRIELGKAYGRDWDGAAEDLVDRSFLPAFRSYDYPGGIATGVSDVIETIALPFQGGTAAPSGEGNGTGWGMALFGGMVALMFSRVWLSPILARFRSCENCGQRGVTVRNEVLKRASTVTSGEGRRTVTCPHCGHVATALYTIARESRDRSDSSSGGSFGGGSSGGGGASGKW